VNGIGSVILATKSCRTSGCTGARAASRSGFGGLGRAGPVNLDVGPLRRGLRGRYLDVAEET
jgi:hypothetical protein